jgi:hypothetical protein
MSVQFQGSLMVALGHFDTGRPYKEPLPDRQAIDAAYEPYTETIEGLARSVKGDYSYMLNEGYADEFTMSCKSGKTGRYEEELIKRGGILHPFESLGRFAERSIRELVKFAERHQATDDEPKKSYSGAVI